MSSVEEDEARKRHFSPDEKFERLDDTLGTGAFKKVYKAIDTQEGTTVAWNEIDIQALPKPEKDRVIQEVVLLQTVQHERIMKYVQSWYDTDSKTVVIVTEILTEGTLKDFTAKIKTIRLRIVRKWCRQILEGLEYMHSMEPPVIHRDLKCDNIFINERGDIKIGDLGLSKRGGKSDKTSTVLGTPEFMAPELFDEQYDETVDIYAFGLAVLEMVSKETPYAECLNVGQTILKITNGVPPLVLDRVAHESLKSFITYCIQKSEAGKRPSASECLAHPFLAEEEDGEMADLMKPLESGEGNDIAGTACAGEQNRTNNRKEGEGAMPVDESAGASKNPELQHDDARVVTLKQNTEGAGSVQPAQVPPTSVDSSKTSVSEETSPSDVQLVAGENEGVMTCGTAARSLVPESVSAMPPSGKSILNPEEHSENHPFAMAGTTGGGVSVAPSTVKPHDRHDSFTDMEEMQLEYRKASKMEEEEKLGQSRVDDVLFGKAFNDTSGCPRAKNNGHDHGVRGNSVSTGGRSRPDRLKKKNHNPIKICYPATGFENGSRYLEGMQMFHSNGHKLTTVNEETKEKKQSTSFNFTYDLLKDDPFALAAVMVSNGFVTHGEQIEVARLLCRLRDKHLHSYALKNANKMSNFHLFKDTPTPRRPYIGMKKVVKGTKDSCKVEKNTDEAMKASYAEDAAQPTAISVKSLSETSPGNASAAHDVGISTRSNSNGSDGEKSVESGNLQLELETKRDQLSEKVKVMRRIGEETSAYVDQKIKEITARLEKKEKEMDSFTSDEDMKSALNKERIVLSQWLQQLLKNKESVAVQMDSGEALVQNLEEFDIKADDTDDNMQRQKKSLRTAWATYSTGRKEKLEKQRMQAQAEERARKIQVAANERAKFKEMKEELAEVKKKVALKQQQNEAQVQNASSNSDGGNREGGDGSGEDSQSGLLATGVEGHDNSERWSPKFDHVPVSAEGIGNSRTEWEVSEVVPPSIQRTPGLEISVESIRAISTSAEQGTTSASMPQSIPQTLDSLGAGASQVNAAAQGDQLPSNGNVAEPPSSTS